MADVVFAEGVWDRHFQERNLDSGFWFQENNARWIFKSIGFFYLPEEARACFYMPWVTTLP